MPPTPTRNWRTVMGEYGLAAWDASRAGTATVRSNVRVGEPCVAVTVPELTSGGVIQDDSNRLKDQRLDSRTWRQARLINVPVKANGTFGTLPRSSDCMLMKAMAFLPQLDYIDREPRLRMMGFIDVP